MSPPALALLLAALLALAATGVRAIDCADGTLLRTGVDCSSSTFERTNFNIIDASNATFDGSTFVSVRFQERSFLERTSFAGTTWSEQSSFTGTNLNLATFRGSNIDTIVFTFDTLNTSTTGAIFNDVNADELTFLQVSGEDMSFTNAAVELFTSVDSDFSGSAFRRTEFRRFEVNGTVFDTTDFIRASFRTFRATGSSFQNARFDNTSPGNVVVDSSVFDRAVFRGVTFPSLRISSSSFNFADFFGTTISSLDVATSTLIGADFSRAIIDDARVSGNLSNALFPKATVQNTVFSDAQLTEANFVDATLTDVTFTGVDLTRAFFRRATLTNVAFVNVSMGGVDLFEATQTNVTVTGIDADCCNACAALDCECFEGCGSVTPGPPPPTAAPPNATADPLSSATPDPMSTATPSELATPSPSASASPQDGDGDDGGDVCFPGAATVELRSGASKPMRELRLGDVVRVSDTEFSPVYFFSHRVRRGLHPFARIAAADGSSVVMTPSHYLYLNGRLEPAGNAKVGDYVATVKSRASRVVSVETIVAEGLFNPHTRNGDIVVGGVVTSTFTTAIPPPLAAVLLLPQKLAARLGMSLYGSMLDASPNAALKLLKGLLPGAKSRAF